MIGESGMNLHLMSSESIQTGHLYPYTGEEPSQESSERPCEGSTWELLFGVAILAYGTAVFGGFFFLFGWLLLG